MRLFRLFNLQKWDHDLANFATRFTTKCVLEHSDSYERKVAAPAFDAVGENLYLIGWTSKNFQKFNLSLIGVWEKNTTIILTATFVQEDTDVSTIRR